MREIAQGLDLDRGFGFVAKQVLYTHLGVSALTNAKDARMSYARALAVERRADKALFAAALAAAVAVAVAVVGKWLW